jgi:hypothetical protein
MISSIVDEVTLIDTAVDCAVKRYHVSPPEITEPAVSGEFVASAVLPVKA